MSTFFTLLKKEKSGNFFCMLTRGHGRKDKKGKKVKSKTKQEDARGLKGKAVEKLVLLDVVVMMKQELWSMPTSSFLPFLILFYFHILTFYIHSHIFTSCISYDMTILSACLKMLLRMNTILANQYRSFQYVLSLLTCFLENFRGLMIETCYKFMYTKIILV